MKSDIFSWGKDTDIAPILSETERFGIFTGLERKEADILRLLAEEMFGMTRGILSAREGWNEWSGAFLAENDGRDFTLRMTVKARITSKARDDFLSAAKDGVNANEKGIFGKLRGVFERMIFASDDVPSETFPLYAYGNGIPVLWSVHAYSSTLDKKEKVREWDGMEKNILIGVADDVIAGVSALGAELTVRKDFSKLNKGRNRL